MLRSERRGQQEHESPGLDVRLDDRLRDDIHLHFLFAIPQSPHHKHCPDPKESALQPTDHFERNKILLVGNRVGGGGDLGPGLDATVEHQAEHSVLEQRVHCRIVEQEQSDRLAGEYLRVHAEDCFGRSEDVALAVASHDGLDRVETKEMAP